MVDLEDGVISELGRTVESFFFFVLKERLQKAYDL